MSDNISSTLGAIATIVIFGGMFLGAAVHGRSEEKEKKAKTLAAAAHEQNVMAFLEQQLGKLPDLDAALGPVVARFGWEGIYSPHWECEAFFAEVDDEFETFEIETDNSSAYRNLRRERDVKIMIGSVPVTRTDAAQMGFRISEDTRLLVDGFPTSLVDFVDGLTIKTVKSAVRLGLIELESDIQEDASSCRCRLSPWGRSIKILKEKYHGIKGVEQIPSFAKSRTEKILRECCVLVAEAQRQNGGEIA